MKIRYKQRLQGNTKGARKEKCRQPEKRNARSCLNEVQSLGPGALLFPLISCPLMVSVCLAFVFPSLCVRQSIRSLLLPQPLFLSSSPDNLQRLLLLSLYSYRGGPADVSQPHVTNLFSPTAITHTQLFISAPAHRTSHLKTHTDLPICLHSHSPPQNLCSPSIYLHFQMPRICTIMSLSLCQIHPDTTYQSVCPTHVSLVPLYRNTSA